MNRLQVQAVTALIVLGLCAAGVVLRARMGAEAANRTVALGVDYNRVQELCTVTGVLPVDLLRRLRQAGATHAIVTEDTLTELVAREKIRLVRRGDAVGVQASPDVRDRVVAQLSRRMPGPRIAADGTLWYPRGRGLDLLGQMGMGYPEPAVADCREAGLGTVARPIGELVVTEAAVDASLDAVQSIGARMIVFYGIQVMGLDDLLPYVSEQLQRRGIVFGFVEMAKQYGDAKLAVLQKARIIRCHAVAVAEMIKLPEARAVDRYALAARERNVRLLYVRPYLMAEGDPAQEAVDHVARVAAAVRAAGLQPGEPQPFRDLQVPLWATLMMLFAVAAATALLVQTFAGLAPRACWGMLAVFVFAALGAGGVATGLASSVGALGAAVVFPLLGLTSVRLGQQAGTPSLTAGLKGFLLICAISACGGLLLAGFLSDLPHMMQLALFRGVKLAQLAPLLVVMLVFAARETTAYGEARAAGSGPEWPALWAGLGDIARSVLRYGHVALMMAGLVMVAVMVMRSGNVSPVPPSELELTVRSVLEDVLIVRPRSKEIALGHPALILTLAFIAGGRRRGAWIGMLLGTIGQVSLVNTFGHVHTSLVISLIRDFNGIWLGAVVAVLVWLVIGAILRSARAHGGRTPAAGST